MVDVRDAEAREKGAELGASDDSPGRGLFGGKKIRCGASGHFTNLPWSDGE